MPRWRVPLLWAYTMRDVARRPLRWLLTLAGIALGVAAATSVLSAIEATRQGYGGMFRPLLGRATHEILPAGGAETFSPDLAAIRAMPGVEEAFPVVQAPAALVTDDGPVPLLVLGVEAEDTIREYSHRPGPGLRLARPFAISHGIAAGDEVTLATPQGLKRVPIGGLLDPTGPMAFMGGAVGIMPLESARRLFAEGRWTAVHAILSLGTRIDVPNAEVRPAGRPAGLVVEFLAGLEQAQVTLCVVAVVAGGLVVVNTVLMHLAERRRLLALLRTLGMSGATVVGLLLRQGLLLGIAGTLIGVPLGVLLAAALLSLNAYYLSVPLPGWPVVPHVLILAMILGPALAVGSVLLPAWAAASRPPLDDLAGRPSSESPPSWLPWLGAALLVGVAAYVVALATGVLPGRVGILLQPAGAAAFLVGSACLLPVALPVLLVPVGWIAHGMEGRLALRLVARDPRRTALTVGVLFAAVTASVSFGTSFDNGMADIGTWFRRTIPDAYLVRPVRPDPATVLASASLAEGLDGNLMRLPGAGTLRRLRFIPIELHGGPALVIAREVPPGTVPPFALHSGDARGIDRGEALLGTALARRLNIDVGGTIELPAPSGPRKVRVAGLVKEYTVGGVALYLGYDEARRMYGFTSPHAIGVDPLPGWEERFDDELSRFCRRHGVVAQTNEQFGSGLIGKVGRGARLLVNGLVLLVALVAAVGVANTLSANILDQSRQLALMRALGMRRGQLWRLVLAQALILGLVGLLTGMPAGLLLAWLMSITTPALLGHVVPFAVDPLHLLACVVGTIIIVMLAAWWPAQRAASLDMAEAVRHA